MKKFKKIIALFLAAMMVCTMISIPVFADAKVTLKMELDKSQIKEGDDAILSIYIEGASEGISMMTYEIAFDSTQYDAVDVTDKTKAGTGDQYINGDIIGLLSLSAVKPLDGEAIQTVKLTAKKNAGKLKLAFDAVMIVDNNGEDYAVDDTSTATLNIAGASWTATSAKMKDSDIRYEAGVKTKEDIVEELSKQTATVYGDAEEEESGFATENWACEGFDSNKPGDYTFTGKVVPNEDGIATWEGDLKVEQVVQIVSATTKNSGTSRRSTSSGNGGSPVVLYNEQTTENIITPNPVATAKSAEVVTKVFPDVEPGYWAEDYIAKLKDYDIISGDENGNFNPEATITRAEFVTMIARSLDLEVSDTTLGFKDCTPSDWYAPYVAAVYEAGYVTGQSSEYFGAEENITREDICTILGRIAGGGIEVAELDFIDTAGIADYAKDYVGMMVTLKVVSGYEDGSFGPKNYATRAETATILARLFERGESITSVVEE